MYSYCRWADDLADETDDPARGLALLDWWEVQLRECYRGRVTHPVFVALLAPWVLGERAHALDLALILTALLGVALVVRPHGAVGWAALVGVLGSLLSGLAYMAVRKLSASEHPLTILVWFPLASIPLSRALCAVSAWPSSAYFWWCWWASSEGPAPTGVAW